MVPTPTLPVFVSKVDESTWTIAVRVQPGAKKSEITGEQEGRLRIRLAAQAIENKANIALVTYIGKVLGVRPSRIQLVAGDTSRQKRVRIYSEQEPDWSRLLV